MSLYFNNAFFSIHLTRSAIKAGKEGLDDGAGGAQGDALSGYEDTDDEGEYHHRNEGRGCAT